MIAAEGSFAVSSVASASAASECREAIDVAVLVAASERSEAIDGAVVGQLWASGPLPRSIVRRPCPLCSRVIPSSR